jgi:D-glycero-D-manno-heptose 1,7-bisphosphate phosphatase
VRAVVIISNVLSSSKDSMLQKYVATVFLDRDGVINAKMPEGEYVCSEAEFRMLPGAPRAIADLNKAGIRAVVVSNQRGVALGLMASAAVERIHAFLQQQLNVHGAHIDGFYYCPHEKNSCTCRKPLPGLFEQSIRDFPDIRAESSVMIGDSFSDIEFGRRLGMRTIWIQSCLSHRKSNWETAETLADWRCSSLADAVDILLRTCRES